MENPALAPVRRPDPKRPLAPQWVHPPKPLSKAPIAERLKAEHLKVGITTLGLVLRDAGFPQRPRRRARAATGVLAAAEADRRPFKAIPGRWATRFGGLFTRDLVPARLEARLTAWPSSRKIPAGGMIRAWLALQLWVRGRPFRVRPDLLDPGRALFAGRNGRPNNPRSPNTVPAWRPAPPYLEDGLARGCSDAAAR